MLGFEDLVSSSSEEINTLWEQLIEKEKGVTAIFQNQQQKDKREVSVKASKPDKEKSGRLGKRLQILLTIVTRDTNRVDRSMYS